jgi:arylsulfatase A-like enzyme
VAIRDGRWKALRRGLLNKKQPQAWELYDLDADRNETRDLAAKHPDIVRRLEKTWLTKRTVEPDFPVPLVDGKTAIE